MRSIRHPLPRPGSYTRPSLGSSPGRRLGLAVAAFAVTTTFAASGQARDASDDDEADGGEGRAKIYRSYRGLRTYAAEDTIPLLYVYGDEVEVEAQRMSLDEILATCIEAERNKYASVEDIQFTTTEKAVLYYGSEPTPETRHDVVEEVSRVYAKQPDRLQTVRLDSREFTVEPGDDGRMTRKPKDEKKDDGPTVQVRATREDLSDLPLFFEDMSEYVFDIVDRRDLETRVLYRISFTPRSEFEPLPAGEFWIDTADFQIVHADLTWEDNVPFPILLKGIDHFSIEKKRVGDVWVYDRISGRIRIRKIPFVDVPQVLEVVVTFSDYVLNQGLSDDVFALDE